MCMEGQVKYSQYTGEYRIDIHKYCSLGRKMNFWQTANSGCSRLFLVYTLT